MTVPPIQTATGKEKAGDVGPRLLVRLRVEPRSLPQKSKRKPSMNVRGSSVALMRLKFGPLVRLKLITAFELGDVEQVRHHHESVLLSEAERFVPPQIPPGQPCRNGCC